jgi:hypothetical protein
VGARFGEIGGDGPAPMACLEALWQRHVVSTKGNHDAAIAGTIGLENFNSYAVEAARGATQQVSSEAIKYLAGRPERLVGDSFLLIHGSQNDPL